MTAIALPVLSQRRDIGRRTKHTTHVTNKRKLARLSAKLYFLYLVIVIRATVSETVPSNMCAQSSHISLSIRAV